MRGGGDNFRDTERRAAERLQHYLDALEDALRADLADPRVTRNAQRHLDLLDAIEGIAPTRAALAECPDGAELAELLLDVVLSRLRPAAELADLHYFAARKGARAATQKRRRRASRTHTKIRQLAAKLNPHLSDSAKARLLAKTARLSVRQLRKIIAK